MKHRPDDPLYRWLAAEDADLEAESEAALAELFAGLPRQAPRAGFAGRVMLAVAAQAGTAPAPARSPGLLASLWLRAALAFTLAAAALAAAVAPGAFGALLGLLRPGRLLSLGVHLLSESAEALGSMLDFLLRFDALGRAASALLSAPPVAATLAGCVLLSAVASYFLHDLLNRSWSHVHPV
jgi:hypothetical protein